MKYLYIFSIVLIQIGAILFFVMYITNKSNYLTLNKRKKAKYAILIPARNESKVIGNILKCLKKQIKSMKDVYIIVESSQDKTCFIAEEYQANIIIRKDLEGKKRKGYALDEGIKEIIKKKKYDLYFIFDADNTLDDNFITEMVKTYQQGYDIATGYRNISNPTNAISACSALTFSMINTISNEVKNKKEKTITISGTGYYISGDLINEWQGFPFHSLTEDYELSLYAAANNISTYYNKDAIFYDEQPDNMKTSITQRTRWVKGFLEARKIRISDVKNDFSKIIGITPYLFLIFGLIMFIIINFINTIYYIINKDLQFFETFKLVIITISLIYFLLCSFTILMLAKENNKINLNSDLKFQSILINPLFLASYIICLFKVLFHKEIKWEPIEHKGITKNN